jgi:hypothetical protein
MKIDLNGNIIWISLYNNIGKDILQTNRGIIYTASGVSDFYLSKLDSTGKLKWQRSYHPKAIFTSFCITKDYESLLLAGFKYNLNQTDIVAVKTDLNDNPIFNKTIKSFIGNYFIVPLSVYATNDSGFIFTGATDFPGGITRDNTYVGKTDSLCNATLLVGISNATSILPNNFILYQNYPNPFNSSTTISYELNKSGLVEFELYDLSGKKITSFSKYYQSPGNYNYQFNTNDLSLSSGVFYLRMFHRNGSDSFNEIKSKTIKLILLK